MSRELHNSVGQLLVALDLTLSSLQRDAALSGEAARVIADAECVVQELLRDIRTMSYLLHPPLLDETGLASALRWYVNRFANRSNIEVELDISSDLDRFSSEVETAAFRIVQESLTNVHRHSGSRIAKVQVHRFNETLVVIVEDKGHGMPSTNPGDTRGISGFGLAGMRERAQQLGGTLEVESTGEGVTVRAVLLAVEECGDPSHTKELAS